jgi:hypothetical protein
MYIDQKYTASITYDDQKHGKNSQSFSKISHLAHMRVCVCLCMYACKYLCLCGGGGGGGGLQLSKRLLWLFAPY